MSVFLSTKEQAGNGSPQPEALGYLGPGDTFLPAPQVAWASRMTRTGAVRGSVPSRGEEPLRRALGAIGLAEAETAGCALDDGPAEQALGGGHAQQALHGVAARGLARRVPGQPGISAVTDGQNSRSGARAASSAVALTRRDKHLHAVCTRSASLLHPSELLC